MRYLLVVALLLSVGLMAGCNGNGKTDNTGKENGQTTGGIKPGDHSEAPTPPPKTKRLEDMSDSELDKRTSMNNETIAGCNTENKLIKNIKHDRFFSRIEKFFWIALGVCGLVMVLSLVIFFWPNVPGQIKTIAVYAFIIALVSGGVCYLLAEYLKIILVAMGIIAAGFGVFCVIYITKHMNGINAAKDEVEEAFAVTSAVADKVANRSEEFVKKLDNTNLINRDKLKALRDKAKAKFTNIYKPDVVPAK